MTKVYCDNEKCAFFRFEGVTGEEHFIKHHKDYSPLMGMGYRGICTREEIGIKPRTLETRDVSYNFNDCKSFSDKGLKGHIDFSRFPQGGRILGSQEHDSSR